MGGPDNTHTPMLAGPALAPLPARALPAVFGGAAVCAAAAAFIWFAAAHNEPGATDAASHLVPASFADLSERLVTPIDSGNAAAIAAAVAALRLPPAQRKDVENDVRSNRRRIGWMVLTDSMDPDGDVVAVESDGIVQHVLLSKMWVPVAVLISESPIGVTAVRDGGGGGITVALASRNGSQAVRIMSPGEHIVVVP